MVQPKDIVNVEYDYIVILSSKFFNEIRRELIETGADSNRILSYRFLEIPNVNVDIFS